MALQAKKTSVEDQLAQYRKKKRREEELAAAKQKISGYLGSVFTFGRPSGSSDAGNAPGPLQHQDGSSVAGNSPGPLQHQDGEEEGTSHATLNARRRRREGSVGEDIEEEDEPPPQAYTRLDWLMVLLKVLMWLLLQKVFILLEFGAVFFIFSAFLFIGYNLRNEPKKKGEASAYSVFNPNCEVLDGTFTAEQFERELLHKM